MASLLGNTGLRSTLSHWWGTRRGDPAAEPDETLVDVSRIERTRSDSSEAQLLAMLENLVIPQLMAGTDSPPPAIAAPAPRGRNQRPAIAVAEVAAFTDLSISEDAHQLMLFVDRLLHDGHSVETIYVGLLAPAARRLGDYWEADREDFVTVTMALWRIQEVLRELGTKAPAMVGWDATPRTALFSTLPGDQHSFGTLMVADCFERAGWQVDVLIEPDRPELTGRFASQHYDLVGLTVSCEWPSGALAELLTTIRTVSRNTEVKVLIGGNAINLHPDLAACIGADGTATDAASAVELADQLVPCARAGSPMQL